MAKKYYTQGKTGKYMHMERNCFLFKALLTSARKQPVAQQKNSQVTGAAQDQCGGFTYGSMFNLTHS